MKLSRVSQLLHESCQLSPDDTLLIGVSGGADSLALLKILLELGYRPIVAHLDHGLRPTSKVEAEYVSGLAEQERLTCVVEKAKVAEFSRKNKLPVEEAARILRYQFLFRTAREVHARAVLVAHTADDQVETVLMHLLRGSGLAGLRGMQLSSVDHGWDDKIFLVRPLLETWKSEVLDYCLEKGLSPVQDESNTDTTYLRNRIRRELIPNLATYNQQIKPAILRLAVAANLEYPLIQAAVEEAWQQCLRLKMDGIVVLDANNLCGHSLGIQASLIRRAAGCLLDDMSNLDQAAVQRALDFASHPRRDKSIDLAGGLKLAYREGTFIISSQGLSFWADKPLLPVNLAFNEQIEMLVPGEVPLENGWKLCSEMIEAPEVQLPVDSSQAFLDADKLTFPLILRCRLPGDRFSPIGMASGSMKLSDFMINEKIPHHVRSRWPLVCSSGRIIWVTGIRQAEYAKIQKDTGIVVHLYLKR